MGRLRTRGVGTKLVWCHESHAIKITLESQKEYS
jgi:hypothetical protein